MSQQDDDQPSRSAAPDHRHGATAAPLEHDPRVVKLVPH